MKAKEKLSAQLSRKKKGTETEQQTTKESHAEELTKSRKNLISTT
jgi:hypothetical protein